MGKVASALFLAFRAPRSHTPRRGLPLQLHAVQSLRGCVRAGYPPRLIPLPVRFVGPPVGLSPSLPYSPLLYPCGSQAGPWSCKLH